MRFLSSEPLPEGVREGLQEEGAVEKEWEERKQKHTDKGRKLWAVRPEEGWARGQRALCDKLRGLNL